MTIRVTPIHGVLLLLGLIVVLLGMNLAVNAGRNSPAVATATVSPAEEPTPAGGPDSTAGRILFESKGTVIGQGSNTKPVGNNGPTTFRVEEVALAQPTTFSVLVPDASQVKLEQKSVEVRKFWRLVLTGGPFDDTGEYWTIWLDNTLLGLGVTSFDTKEMAVAVFDRAYLREGATITLALGKERTNGVALPEKLHLNPGN